MGTKAHDDAILRTRYKEYAAACRSAVAGRYVLAREFSNVAHDKRHRHGEFGIAVFKQGGAVRVERYAGTGADPEPASISVYYDNTLIRDIRTVTHLLSWITPDQTVDAQVCDVIATSPGEVAYGSMAVEILIDLVKSGRITTADIAEHRKKVEASEEGQLQPAVDEQASEKPE